MKDAASSILKADLLVSPSVAGFVTCAVLLRTVRGARLAGTTLGTFGKECTIPFTLYHMILAILSVMKGLWQQPMPPPNWEFPIPTTGTALKKLSPVVLTLATVSMQVLLGSGSRDQIVLLNASGSGEVPKIDYACLLTIRGETGNACGARHKSFCITAAITSAKAPIMFTFVVVLNSPIQKHTETCIPCR